MLPKKSRLSSRQDFARILAVKGGYRSGPFSLKAVKSPLPHNRFAVTVPTTVSKKATVRNTLRRRFHAILEKANPKLQPGFDCVFRAYPGAEKLDFSALEAHIYDLLSHSGLLQ